MDDGNRDGDDNVEMDAGNRDGDDNVEMDDGNRAEMIMLRWMMGTERR